MAICKRRKWGRKQDAPHMVGATHLIKIGFDKRRIGAKTKDGKDSYTPIPGKLSGFLVMRNTLDAKGNQMIDFEAMRELNCTPEMIDEALQKQQSAENLLPTTLHFVLPNDAKRAGDGWDFGDLFSEQYNCWRQVKLNGPDGKPQKDYKGREMSTTLLFCEGDGMNATRIQPDGTKRALVRTLPDGRQVGCVPYGSTDDPAEWCEYSFRKECRMTSHLNLCLFRLDGAGKPQPVSRALGWSARFRVSSCSEFNPIGFVNELTAAADKLDGRMAMLTGTITFQIQRRRYEGGLAHVGQIVMQLDQSEIERRRRMLHQERLEDKGYLAPKLIAAPEPETLDLGAAEAVPVASVTVEQDPFDSPAADGLDADYDAQDITTPAEIGLTTPEMGEASNGDLTVETASDDQLRDALRDGLEEFAAGDPKRYVDELNDLTFGNPDGYQVKDGRRQIEDVEWFFAATGDKDKQRRAMLRAACVKAEGRGWNLFGEVE